MIYSGSGNDFRSLGSGKKSGSGLHPKPDSVLGYWYRPAGRSREDIPNTELLVQSWPVHLAWFVNITDI